jgi:hypothetical protein
MLFRTGMSTSRIIIIIFLMIIATITSPATATATATVNTSNHAVDPISSLLFLRGSRQYTTAKTDERNIIIVAPKSRLLTSSSHTISIYDFNNEWNSLNPDQQLMTTFGLVIISLFCCFIIVCLCNLFRGNFCGGRGGRGGREHYHRIDNNNYNNFNGNHHGNGNGNENENGDRDHYRNRSCMNILWPLCCFECCCRDNQDVYCCDLCLLLFCTE